MKHFLILTITLLSFQKNIDFFSNGHYLSENQLFHFFPHRENDGTIWADLIFYCRETAAGEVWIEYENDFFARYCGGVKLLYKHYPNALQK